MTIVADICATAKGYLPSNDRKENPEKQRDACMEKRTENHQYKYPFESCDETQDRQAWEYLQTMDGKI